MTPGNPNLFFNGTTGTVYSVATGLFHVQATSLSVKFVSGGADSILDTTQPRSLTIDFYVDQNGSLVSGVAGDDLVVTGTVTDPANITYTGILLKGEIRGFGYLNLSSTDAYDFRFAVTGGSLAPLFAGKDIGIRYQSEGSTFNNSFKVNFSGGAKGNLGPITALCSGSIGNYVWFDTNRNGIQDGGEHGIDGVKVILKDGNGNVITSTTTVSVPTSQAGYYQFTGLCAGDYKVEVDTTSVPAGLVPTIGVAGSDRTVDSNGSPADVNLPTNRSSDQTLDFGYISPCTGSIGDFVWHDKNRNGLQEAGEPGLAGVTVNLLNPTDNSLLATAFTGSNGVYQFTGLCAGDYQVQVDAGTLPAGFTPTTGLVGSDRTVDSNGNPATVTLLDDMASDQTLDFGYVSPCTGSLGDFVWHDKNRNGLQDTDEPGLDGVTAKLLDPVTNTTLATAITGPNGAYQFTGLCAGDYKVEVDAGTLPAGFTPTISTAGLDRAVDSNGSPALVNLPDDNTTHPTLDFGYVSPCTGSLGDFVWHDKNRDGLQEAGEPGLAGVKLNLLNPMDNSPLATTTTGSNGAYQFTGLCAGDYKVEVDAGTLPAGFIPTTPTMGSDRAVDSNGSPATVALPDDNDSDQSIDFGYVSPCTGSVSNFVWHDKNRNGLQNAGEPGLDGVTVKLLDPATNTVLATAITGPNGAYQFTGLCAGDYKVEVDAGTLPVGFTPTTSTAGPDRTVDSNGSPATVTLPNDNDSDQSIDFGYVSPCTGSVGNFLWHDKNRNGLQNAGEPGLDGVTVKLLDLTTHATLATAITGPNGAYQFTGLCAGDYKVEVDAGTLPVGFTPTTSTAGPDRTVDSNGSPAIVTLPDDNDSDQSVDFGYVSPCTGSLGDLVWFDQDRNGIQSTGEPGLGAVVVNLRNPADNTLVATNITKADGSYQFTGLCAGAYKVEVVQPNDYEPTLINASGSTPANDSDNPNGTPVTLPTDNSSDQTIDFGYKTLPIAGVCDLSLQETVSSTTLQIPDGVSCQNVDYTYTVTNRSNDAVDVALTDDKLPLGTDGTFTLAINETKTVTKTACLSQTTTNMAIATGTLITSPDTQCSAVASATVTLETCKGSVTVAGGNLVVDQSKGIAYADLTNHSASQSFLVGLASYRKFDEIIDRQEINDWQNPTIGPGQTLRLQVKIPTCAAQIDLFCGQVLQSLNGQRYNDRKLDWIHIGGTNYCTSGGTQGCSPGYWKNHSTWPAPYRPNMLFKDAGFDNAFSGKTMSWVLNQGGGGLTALGRQTVAALLNAKALGSKYAFTIDGVVSKFNGVYPGTSASYDPLQNQFNGYNDKDGKSCPLH